MNATAPAVTPSVRMQRQAIAVDRTRRLMGDDALREHPSAMRMLQSAVALARALGVSARDISGLVGGVYAVPIRTPDESAGRLAVHLYLCCASVGLDADREEYKALAELGARLRRQVADGQTSPPV